MSLCAVVLAAAVDICGYYEEAAPTAVSELAAAAESAAELMPKLKKRLSMTMKSN